MPALLFSETNPYTKPVGPSLNAQEQVEYKAKVRAVRDVDLKDN